MLTLLSDHAPFLPVSSYLDELFVSVFHISCSSCWYFPNVWFMAPVNRSWASSCWIHISFVWLCKFPAILMLSIRLNCGSLSFGRSILTLCNSYVERRSTSLKFQTQHMKDNTWMLYVLSPKNRPWWMHALKSLGNKINMATVYSKNRLLTLSYYRLDPEQIDILDPFPDWSMISNGNRFRWLLSWVITGIDQRGIRFRMNQDHQQNSRSNSGEM